MDDVQILSLAPNVKTLGGPVSRGAQAIPQSISKEILSILSDKIMLCASAILARYRLRLRRGGRVCERYKERPF